MTRLDKFLLMLLAGLGWGCVFALVGLGLLKGVPGNTVLVAVFAAFGFVAGALLVPLRLVLQAVATEHMAQAQRRAQTVREPVSSEPVTASAMRAHA